MLTLKRLFVTATALLVLPHTCFPQTATGVPFLLISSSPEANGMGGISSGSVSMHPMASLGNAGQIGLFAMSNLFSGGIYMPGTNQVAGYQLPDLSYSTLAFNAGVNLHDILGVPIPLGVGIGYARVSFDLGEFTLTSSSGPTSLGRFKSYELSDNIVFGAGIDYWVRIGAGVNFKIINSHLTAIGAESEKGSGSANATAYDIGLLMQVPVTGIASKLGADLPVLPGKTEPLFELTLGYTKRNIGDAISYISGAQSDPLPRSAAFGVGLELGAESRMLTEGWKLFDVVIAREADDILVTRSPDGTWSYVSGSGAINVMDNVILGNPGDRINQRKGWRVDLAEIFSFRQGSVTGVQSQYSTVGFGIRLAGMLKLVSALNPEDRENWVGFLLKTLDVRYDYSSYDHSSVGTDSESYGSISVVLKRIPL